MVAGARNGGSPQAGDPGRGGLRERAALPTPCCRRQVLRRRATVHPVKMAQAKVVRGAIVTRSKFPDGTRLTLVEHDERTPITVGPDDEAAILKGIEEIEAGHGIPVTRARARLRLR